MAKRTRMPTDLNQRAKRIVDLATSDEELPDKDEARSEGGRKDGKARAERLTAGERSAIAKRAADARWRV